MSTGWLNSKKLELLRRKEIMHWTKNNRLTFCGIYATIMTRKLRYKK